MVEISAMCGLSTKIPIEQGRPGEMLAFRCGTFDGQSRQNEFAETIGLFEKRHAGKDERIDANLLIGLKPLP